MTINCGYKTQEVTKIIGLTQRQLDYWDRTGFFCPSIAAGSGRGKSRIYSFSDLVQLKIIKNLRSAGVTLQSLRAIAKHFRTIKGLEAPLYESRLVVSGDDVIFVKNNEELMSVLKLPGQGVLCFVLNVNTIVEELKGEIIEKQNIA